MKNRWLRPLLFAAAGALIGYLYYTFFGCNGTCPITASPWRTMLYTCVIGFLLSGITAKKV